MEAILAVNDVVPVSTYLEVAELRENPLGFPKGTYAALQAGCKRTPVEAKFMQMKEASRLCGMADSYL